MSKTQSPKATERMLHVRVSDTLHRRLRIAVAKQDSTLQKWITEVLERELAKSKK